MNKWLVIYQNPETARPGRSFPDLTPPPSGTSEGLDTPAHRLYAHLRKEIADERVIQAMEHVPRELFVPAELRHLAYLDEALPIGEGQTISQPLIVAMMTSALDLKGHERVLEVGTGSGYQAAILAQLAKHVISVERCEKLAASARDRLASLNIRNVTVYLAGQTLGWPAEAPYDAILVTAAAPRIPQTLVKQLNEGSPLVIPVGSRFEQELIVATKSQGDLKLRNLGGCRFVPLIGPDAWDN